MPGTISESYLSRPFDLGTLGSRELVFDIQGTEDESEVANLILSEAPGIYLGLIRDTISAEPLGNGVWKGYARYSGIEGESEFTFDTGGGSSKTTQSLTTINTYAPAGVTAPNFQGAIGVTEDRVEGVDIVTPTFEFTETHYFFDTAVTQAYKLVLFNLTGCTNDATFKGFATGECLFMGASGSRRGDERWAITFRFAASPNIENQTLGTITGVAKKGWEYLWVRYADYEDASAFALVKRPVSAYIEKVYFDANFANLGIGV